MMKKFLAFLLAACMVLSLAACGGTPSSSSTPDSSSAPSSSSEPEGDAEPTFVPATYEDRAVYDGALGEFYTLMQEAKECVDIDEMYAKMAIAEAKFTESATVFPIRGDGGSFGITHVAPRSVPSILWGSDSDRYETAILTNELITVEDRKALREMWNEVAGTGTYDAKAKEYLTDKGYTFNDSYGYAYASDPETWDALAAWTNTVSEPVCLTVESLGKYDQENVLQPALAESWETSEDGLTWTFHIRPGQQWVDSQGRKLDDIKADDWVAALQHMIDCYADSPAQVIVPMIVNADEYYTGEVTDFSEVGVEAVDDTTLVYHLTHPVATFETMLAYCSFFAPLCRSYYESQGGTFGPDHDSGTYGSDVNHIAYCGPYLITSHTARNSIIFEENPTYWNAGNLNIKKISFLYNDGTDATKAYEDCKANTIASCGLGTAALQKCKEDTDENGDNMFEKYGNLQSDLNSTTRIAGYNLNRQSYALFNDETSAVSEQEHGSVDAIDRDNEVYTSDILDDAARTHAALNNQNFRLALTFAFDRAGYYAQRAGEELKYVAIRNSYTPANFASLKKETTVEINGTATTFPAGTQYGEIMQAQIDADGYPIQVWNDELKSGDGYDGWYSVENAKKYLEKAIEELAAQGVEISKENPIQIDEVYGSMAETFVKESNAYKQSIEEALDGLVIINLIPVSTQEELNYSAFWNPTGAESCVDISIGTAWTPDYGDPASYLDTFLPEGDGYMCKYLGLW